MFFICSAGSNIDPRRNIGRAIQRIVGRLAPLALGLVVRTPPYDIDSDRDFLNTVFLCFSPLNAKRLKTAFRGIEAELGRDIDHPERSRMDRPIDLDILYAGPYRSPDDVHFEEPYVRACLPGGSGHQSQPITVGQLEVGRRPMELYAPRPGNSMSTRPMSPLCRAWLAG
jgi:2-amino-4-hydroxy-6-hydroxymethyldihydropteridine diphosphokinase